MSRGSTPVAWTSRAGAALLMVLLVLTALSVLMLESSRTMQVEEINAAMYVKGAQADSLLLSGLELVAALLLEDAAKDAPGDHYGERWATFWRRQAELAQGPTGGQGTVTYFTTGELELEELVDESGKFPLNALTRGPQGTATGQNASAVPGQNATTSQNGTAVPEMRDMFVRLLHQELKIPLDNARAVTATLIDWMDADEESTDGLGAESAYYQLLANPYKAKNAKIAVLDELLLLRGVPPEILDDRRGLASLVTVHSEGKININTAPEILLRAMPGGGSSLEDSLSRGKEFATAVRLFRDNPDNFEELQDASWVRKLPAFQDAAHFPLPDNYLTASSNFFTVRLKATCGVAVRHLVACLERRKPPPTIPPGAETPFIKVVFQEFY